MITQILLKEDGSRTVYHRTDGGSEAWEHADTLEARSLCRVCNQRSS